MPTIYQRPDPLILWTLIKEENHKFLRIRKIQQTGEMLIEWQEDFQKGPGRRLQAGVLWFESHELMERHFNLLSRYFPEVSIIPCSSIAIRLPRRTALELQQQGRFHRAYQEGWWMEAGDDNVLHMPLDERNEVYCYGDQEEDG